MKKNSKENLMVKKNKADKKVRKTVCLVPKLIVYIEKLAVHHHRTFSRMTEVMLIKQAKSKNKIK